MISSALRKYRGLVSAVTISGPVDLNSQRFLVAYRILQKVMTLFYKAAATMNGYCGLSVVFCMAVIWDSVHEYGGLFMYG